MKKCKRSHGESRTIRSALLGLVLAATTLLAACDSSPAETAGNTVPDLDVTPVTPADPLGKGMVYSQSIRTIQDSYPYLVYTPVGWKKGDKLPLYVMLHGCGTTPEEQMNANLLNPLADRERFVVLYADVSTIARMTGVGVCFRAGLAIELTSIIRGLGGDADGVAAMTQAAIQEYTIDPERVYLMGMSAGAFQATATGAAYSDLFAAIGVNAGGGYAMGFPCVAFNDSAVTPYAQLAVAAMGANAHPMPFFSIGGTLDPLGETPAPGGCSRLAFKQWMATNNILATGDANGTAYVPDDASTQTGAVPDGYAWTRSVWRDQKGCEIGERWVVDGMGHFWSGGTSDPMWAAFTDPKGPSASVASWRFFKQFTLSGGNVGCAKSSS